MSRSVVTRVLQTILAVLLVVGAAAPRGWGQAGVQGQWSTLPSSMPINPIHVILMHNGKILVVDGSGNCPASQSGCPSGAPYGPSNGSGALVLDPSTQTITQMSVAWDMFCNSMTALADGRILIDGGTLAYDPFLGSPKASIFDPSNNSMTDVQNMAHGRWYPTVTLLGDGRVMTFSGSNDSTGATNQAVEFYTVGSGWSQEYQASWTPPLYPRDHLLPNGKVVSTGPQSGTHVFNPANQTWTLNVAFTNYGHTRTYGSSVMLPLTPANGYDPRIMILGGDSPATASTEFIDMGASNPTWINGPAMSQARIEMNAVLLPNGRIVAIGGSVNDEDATTKSLNADIFNTEIADFTKVVRSSGGANAFARLYHSVALLLPDATVWVAGGNPTRGTFEQHMEIYKPAYLFNSDGSAATRPTISSAPSTITWNGSFNVSTPDAANISQVILMRPGSATHSFNMDQRYVGMSFTAGSGTLTVTAPPNSNIAPPGYYMLFIINNQGVPSVAPFVLLTSVSNPAPTVSAISPTSGSANGGTAVTITGTGFLGGATVKLGGSSATGVTVVSSTSITATTPAHSSGSVNVVVTNSDSQSGTLTNGYSYNPSNPAPTVSKVSPSSGSTAGGSAISITGTGFLAGATVKLGGSSATGVTVVSSTSITATTPAHSAGSASIVVTNTDGQSGTLTNGYSYVNPAPSVSAVTPNAGPGAGGAAVTITGTNFLTGATVSFGGTAATGVTVVSSTSITATTPSHPAGTVNVVVINSDNQSGSLANAYTYSNGLGSPGLGLDVAPGWTGSLSIAAGQSGAYTLAIGGDGISGTATLTCTGAPLGATCTMPATIAFSGTSASNFDCTVTTTSRIVAAVQPHSTRMPWSWAIAAMGLVLWPRSGGGSKRTGRRYLKLAPLGLLLFTISCGGGAIGGNGSGGQQTNPNGTPAGTYTLTVTATSGSASATMPLTLTVK